MTPPPAAAAPCGGPRVVACPYLEEDVGAGAVEAVGPGVERGDEGTAFQGAAPGAGPLGALPLAHGALAADQEGATRLAPPDAPGWQSRLPPGLRLPHTPCTPPHLCAHAPWQAAPHSPGLAGRGHDLPRGVDHPSEQAGTLGGRHAGVVFGDVIQNRVCRGGFPGPMAGRPPTPRWAALPGSCSPFPRPPLALASTLPLGQCA